jgi:hypothetical protein
MHSILLIRTAFLKLFAMKKKKNESTIFISCLFLFLATIAMNSNQIKIIFAANVPVQCYVQCEYPYHPACSDNGTVGDCNQHPCGTVLINWMTKPDLCPPPPLPTVE